MRGILVLSRVKAFAYRHCLIFQIMSDKGQIVPRYGPALAFKVMNGALLFFLVIDFHWWLISGTCLI